MDKQYLEMCSTIFHKDGSITNFWTKYDLYQIREDSVLYRKDDGEILCIGIENVGNPIFKAMENGDKSLYHCQIV